MRLLENAELNSDARVLVRCDLDVPLINGVIQETYRLEQLLPTLKSILEKGSKLIICGHIGRPAGKEDYTLSTEHLKDYFNKHLGEKTFTLLENLRFDPGEDANSITFAKKLALHADIYVNESFATCHRFSASMVSLPEIMPSYAGLRLQKEITTLEKVLKDPVKPLIAVIGGAKMESKKPAVKKFISIADLVLVGGKIGLDWDEEIPENLVLPTEYGTENKDIGGLTRDKYAAAIRSAKTVIWAGPMGLFEDNNFITGTRAIAEAMSSEGVHSIVGGGDTIAALNKLGMLDRMSFVSTGGSAMLEFLIQGSLPALESLGYNG